MKRSQDMVQWWSSVNTVKNICVRQLFWQRIIYQLLHEIMYHEIGCTCLTCCANEKNVKSENISPANTHSWLVGVVVMFGQSISYTSIKKLYHLWSYLMT
jgi:hypothetical protein